VNRETSCKDAIETACICVPRLWTLRVSVGGGFVAGNVSVMFAPGSGSAYPPFLVPNTAPFVITFGA
jgi:hypothetical protein